MPRKITNDAQIDYCQIIYILHMPNENNDLKNIDLEALIGNMSSINSEDYWFTKVSKIEEHDESTSEKPDSNKA